MIATVFTEIEQTLKTALPTILDIGISQGPLSLEDLTQELCQLPALRLIPQDQVMQSKILPNGETEANFDLSIYLITQEDTDKTALFSAFDLLENILALVAQNSWQLENMSPAKNLTISNHHSLDATLKGLSIWSVRWTQTLRLPTWASLNGGQAPALTPPQKLTASIQQI